MPTIKRDHIKLKRNSICPCEENEKRDKPKKYKRCCLRKMQDQEQQAYMLIHHNERIGKEKKIVADAIQHDIDHPIILPDNEISVPDSGESNIILP
ncbi:hypothetical protein LCGC14_2588090 [marine sediment metagenome]|uniref:Uncharacterized protein n=1 Tax=marine sediment metagenome TaxID=412755 RepID=A0A0F9ACX3_9ZZZZ